MVSVMVAPADQYSPAKHYSSSVFMAGGITGCPDWQAYLMASLADTRLLLINPRRANFDVTDPSMSEAQIRWERKYLGLADIIMFWFPEETLCPITLYELGRWVSDDVEIVVGTHPNYARRFDVITQVGLERPELTVVDSLETLAEEVRKLDYPPLV